ncbi:MAG: M48 family metallopeptidase [Gammaproteobacteria bacterium]|nr:M48 family metallopeptidase [Gammaproteobacteria bacterium]
MENLTLVFLVALVGGLGLQLWLGMRQSAHIRAHRAAVPDAFADRIPLPDHQKAADYSLAGLRLNRWDLLLSAAVALAWTLGGGIDLLSGLVAQLTEAPLWAGVLLVLGVILIGSLVELPLSIWRTFGIETRYGFNRTTPVRFAVDRVLGLVLTLLLGVPLLGAILWLMQSAGSGWWLWAWLLWMGFTLLLTWAYPIWIAPLFNKFKPLDDDALRQRLETLLQRCGFRSNGMFVMDGSSRSSHGNAYFTGFGANKRIVFFDTLLDGLDAAEVEAVLAHELGHFKRRHVVKMLLLSAVMSLLGLALLGWLTGQPWFYSGLGVDRVSDGAALALFLLVLPVFTVFVSPLMAMFSRRHEFEADDFAAEQTDPRDLVSGLIKMYRDNASTLTPDPLYSAFYHSHPPAPVRIAHLSARMST